MGLWQDSLVYWRDFGYPDSSRRILAMAQNVGEANAKTFAELVAGPIVDVYVGETKQHWPIHRNILAFHSEYLQTELQHSPDSTPRKKGQTDNLRLDLPDDDPAGFELLVKWLYQGKIEDVSNIADDQDKYDYAVSCQKLHQLCERLDLPRLKNIAMDQYRKALNQAGLVPDPEELNVIYRQSAEQSPFRKLMVNIAARQIMDPDSDKDAESYRPCFENNADFAVELINAIKKGMGGLLFEDPTEETGCEYHDHNEGPNCHVRGKKKLAVSRSDFSARQTDSSPSTPATSRPGGTTSLATPHINGFAETNDRYPASRSDDGKAENNSNDYICHDERGKEEFEDDDDFKSALSEAGTSSFSRTPTRILNSPKPGRRTPRKISRRSLGSTSEWEAPSERAISKSREGRGREPEEYKEQDTV
ncbi:uncharacterized protein PV09_00554 [Verruconis gallopava]|uniref:BTB domain-containing protein n=1 Tax=Verruconis gallopava TaxID=253628 RepID=A0A0D1Z6L9_9PEZI|nr:uncharacterized protein PV09_00554 [Verruconis gallopava]KIW08592.1 hypothetical protein PV09_00554 [Verruconis gallopava]